MSFFQYTRAFVPKSERNIMSPLQRNYGTGVVALSGSQRHEINGVGIRPSPLWIMKVFDKITRISLTIILTKLRFSTSHGKCRACVIFLDRILLRKRRCLAFLTFLNMMPKVLLEFSMFVIHLLRHLFLKFSLLRDCFSTLCGILNFFLLCHFIISNSPCIFPVLSNIFFIPLQGVFRKLTRTTVWASHAA